MPSVSPRWLTADEQRSWRAYLESSKVLLEALDRQLQRGADMPLAYYEILFRLSEARDHALRMSDLATITCSSRSRVSHAVARLEERGWVQRADCATDRRGQIASLTPAGMDVLVVAAPLHVASARELVIDVLTPDQLAQLAAIGEKIIARVGEVGLSGGT